MTEQLIECDDRQLLAALGGNDDELSGPLARHVEQCSHCQSRLSELAATKERWRKAAAAFSPEDQRLQPGDRDAFQGERAYGAERSVNWNWNEALVRQLLAPPSHPEMLGRLGRYEIERLVGSGGMGIVFKAHDTELNRPVALKILAPHLASSGSARQRFAREARSAAGIVDDHVVPIHNVESEADPPFLVMQYVAGGSLQEKLDRCGPLSVAEVVRIGLQAAKGLAAAHSQGLIHRDVKPSNILLDEGVERALLTDFGLARTEDDACLTCSGFQPGTPHYMSPEQVRGDSIDGRSDLFGLGCVLYALCTGRPPFRAESGYAVLRRITDESPRPIRDVNPDIPEWLEGIVMKLLEKDCQNRVQSAEEVVEALSGWLAHLRQPKLIPAPALPTPVPREPCRSKGSVLKYLLTTGAAVLMALAGIALFLETGKGTLRIECNSDVEVPIRIVQGNKAVRELTVSKDGAITRLRAGTYVIEIPEPNLELSITGDRVELKRGEQWIARIEQRREDRDVQVHDTLKSQGTDSYQQPDFEAFFPDDVDGGLALDRLWNATDRDQRSDAEVLKTVRQGLRRTREHRTLVLAWIGGKYIWNKSPQHPVAVEIMYHAADFRGEKADRYGTRHYAVYFGLSVVQPKSPAILRTLAELSMAVDDPNDLDRIAWGAANQKLELVSYLSPFLDDRDPAVVRKAEVCRQIFMGETKAFAWAAEEARKRAALLYEGRLRDFKETLLHGSSEARLDLLETILSERIALIMDDSFVGAFATCGNDSDSAVRNNVAIIAGDRWVWGAKTQNVEAIDLMLQLSKDRDAQVRYNAVYYGLSTVRDKSDEVVTRLLEMALVDREPNLFGRIVWGVRENKQQVRRILDQIIDGSNEQRAQAARDVKNAMLGGKSSAGEAAGDAVRDATGEGEGDATGEAVRGAVGEGTRGSVNYDARSRVRLYFRGPRVAKLKLVNESAQSVVAPGRLHIHAGEVYGLELSHIPDQKDSLLGGWLELAPVTSETASYLHEHDILLDFSSDEIAEVGARGILTKVIYLTQADGARPRHLKILSQTLFEPVDGDAPINKARLDGDILAVVRLGESVYYDNGYGARLRRNRILGMQGDSPRFEEGLQQLHRLRVGRAPTVAEAEAIVDQLLSKFPERRATIHGQAAHLFGQSGIKVFSDAVCRHARESLKSEDGIVERSRMFMYLSNAHEVQGQPSEANYWALRGLLELQPLNLPRVAPDLPMMGRFNDLLAQPGDGSDGGARQKIYRRLSAAEKQARDAAMQTRELVRFRDIYVDILRRLNTTVESRTRLQTLERERLGSAWLQEFVKTLFASDSKAEGGVEQQPADDLP